MKDYRDDRILQWIVGNNLYNSKGINFEFYDHQFLIDPLIDWHPRQGIIKSAQIGVSESIGIMKALFAAKELKYNIIYTLPTDSFLQKFVPPKVDRIVKNNLILGDVQGGITLKKVGVGLDQRFINFMGTFNSKSDQKKEETSKGVSFTSDINIHDESSRSDQFVLNQLRSRLDDSTYKGRWLIDNPTYPLMGADSIWVKSDQRHYIIQCSRCKYKQYMDWVRLDKVNFESGTTHCWVDVEKKQFLCGKCLKPIRDDDRIDGEWIPKFPRVSDFRGYWMPQMIYVRHKAIDILEKEEDTTIEQSFFYNFVLGKPYISSDIKIERTNIISNLDGNKNDLQNNAMGVDQGRVKWFVIGNEQGIFKVGHTESWEEIEYMKKKYNAKMVCDALPYQRYPKILTERYPNSCWRAFYKPEAEQRAIAQYGTNNDRGVVLIKREDTFDVIADLILDNKFPIQVAETDLELFIKHWVNLVKVIEPDSMGNQKFRWHSVTGEDHLAHATLYFYVALQRAKIGRALIKSMDTQQEKQESPYILAGNKMKQNVINDFTKHL